MNSEYILDDRASEPEEEIIDTLHQFRLEIPTLESEKDQPFLLLQDGKSQAFYIECHIEASEAIPLADLDAVLDPEEQEQFRLQRELQPANRAFLLMCSDAIGNRQFADIIAEYDTSYRPETPLKILGGQHRTEAIKRALENQGISRFHGFRIYFGLSIDQRNEIAQIANTNIAISADLIDRMQETVRGPQLRSFCHRVELLEEADDFADRRNPDGKITVRLARTFIVNFFEGRKNRNKDLEKCIFTPYVCKSGQEDPKYLSLMEKKIWNDEGLLDAGENFAKLHNKQKELISQNPELNKSEFRNKAVSMAVISSWAFVAGAIQGNSDALEKLFSLPDSSGKTDPLVAKQMSESSHPKDPPTYRGLGTRYTKEDLGRVTELFLQYSLNEKPKRITKVLIESAIANYEAKVAVQKAKKLKERAH
jgi:hypothetical protein